MRGTDGINLSNVAPGTTKFGLSGGRYCLDTLSTGTGTIDVKQLAGDGATYNGCGVTTVSATSGFQTGIELPPGQYEIIIATFTANYISLTRIPGE